MVSDFRVKGSWWRPGHSSFLTQHSDGVNIPFMWKKILLIAVVVGLFGAFFATGLHHHLTRLSSTASIPSPRLLFSFALLGLFPLVAGKLLSLYRAKAGKACEVETEKDLLPPALPVVSPVRLEAAFGRVPEGRLADLASSLAEECTRCGACVKQCAFLQKVGMPGEIAGAISAPPSGKTVSDPFECSLCDLCGAVCPEKLSPALLFLEMRRHAVSRNAVDLGRYKAILGYEARGQSERYSWYGLPRGCDTVFFPGCTLPGTRPEATWRIFEILRREVPSLGIALDCCAKPSHDLGRSSRFHASFAPISRYLSAHGVRNVLAACPNCTKVFEQYGDELRVSTVWERLVEAGAFEGTSLAGQVTVHDPCPLRNASGIQDAVREGIGRMGLSIRELRHKRRLTLCCGEGGSVGLINPAFARRWGARRKIEAEGDGVVTYCAGCAGYLRRAGAKASHLADFLVDPQAAANGRSKVSAAPWTYLNRIRLRKRFQEAVAAANTGPQPAQLRRR